MGIPVTKMVNNFGARLVKIKMQILILPSFKYGLIPQIEFLGVFGRADYLTSCQGRASGSVGDLVCTPVKMNIISQGMDMHDASRRSSRICDGISNCPSFENNLTNDQFWSELKSYIFPHCCGRFSSFLRLPPEQNQRTGSDKDQPSGKCDVQIVPDVLCYRDGEHSQREEFHINKILALRFMPHRNGANFKLGHYQEKISFTLARVCWLRDGFK